MLSGILIYLVLAARSSKASAIRSSSSLGAPVPLALQSALLFSFLGLTTLNIYSQVGLITLVGLISKYGILDRRVYEPSSGNGKEQTRCDHHDWHYAATPRSLMTTAAAFTVCGHFPLVLAKGRRCRKARNSIGIMLV